MFHDNRNPEREREAERNMPSKVRKLKQALNKQKKEAEAKEQQRRKEEAKVKQAKEESAREEVPS